MNVIFLDVDGVLNSTTTKEKICGFNGIEDEKVSLLKQLRDYMNGEIVLISSWKEGWPKEGEKIDRRLKIARLGKYLVEKLKKYDMEIYDKTEEGEWYLRHAGIHEWLKSHPGVRNFVILDDENFRYEKAGLGSYFIKTSFYDSERLFSYRDGLEEEHIKQAMLLYDLRILRNRW